MNFFIYSLRKFFFVNSPRLSNEQTKIKGVCKVGTLPLYFDFLLLCFRKYSFKKVILPSLQIRFMDWKITEKGNNSSFDLCQRNQHLLDTIVLTLHVHNVFQLSMYLKCFNLGDWMFLFSCSLIKNVFHFSNSFPLALITWSNFDRFYFTFELGKLEKRCWLYLFLYWTVLHLAAQRLSLWNNLYLTLWSLISL